MTIGEIILMKPHESPRINKKSIRGDSWPVWNRGIKCTTIFMKLPEIRLNLIIWLQDREVIEDFSRDCVRYIEGRLTLKNGSSCGRDGVIWRCTKKECWYKGACLRIHILSLKEIVKLTY